MPHAADASLDFYAFKKGNGRREDKRTHSQCVLSAAMFSHLRTCWTLHTLMMEDPIDDAYRGIYSNMTLQYLSCLGLIIMRRKSASFSV